MNIRQIAQAPYRGLTALVNGKPYLIIDKDGDHYILEGEDGDTIKLERFAWVDGTDSDKLIAASRVEGSGFELGTMFGGFIAGRLVHDAGIWYIRNGLSDVALPLEQILEAKEASLDFKIGDDFGNEIKWFVTPEGEVLMEDPQNPVPNHLALLAQQKGRDYIRAVMSNPDAQALGLQGTIQDGGINVGGYLMSDSSSPPRTLDPSKSWAGHVKVRNAVNHVRDEATARGIPLQGDAYNIPVVRPGEGISTRPRPFTSALRGAFHDYATGERIEFYELEHEPSDKAAGIHESWKLQSIDGRDFTLHDDGRILDDQGNVVGKFNPYVAKTAANTFEYALPPGGLHGRTDRAMQGAGLSAIVHYPPGITAEHPEGFSARVPGDGMENMFIVVDYPDEHEGQSIEGVPVQVETNDDPRAVIAIFDALGGREPQDIDLLPDNVRKTLNALRGRQAMTQKQAEEITDLYTDEEKKALECPKCGSHTLRAFNVDKSGNAEMKCLTCGNVFARKVYRNPEASVKESDMGPGTYGQPGPQYPIDPQLQTQIMGLMQQISQATDPQQKQQLQMQLEQLLGGNPATQQNAQPLQPQQTYAMRGDYEVPNDVDHMRSEVIQQLGFSHISLDQNDKINAILDDLIQVHGGVPNRSLQSEAYKRMIDEATEIFKDEMIDPALDQSGGDDTLESLGIPPSGEDYYRDASVDSPPDWFMIRLNEELTNEIMREAGLLKGAPYPENSYKNAPDHTPKGQKTWPKEVNAVYNACRRENQGDEEKCAKIAWAQYKKSASLKQAFSFEQLYVGLVSMGLAAAYGPTFIRDIFSATQDDPNEIMTVTKRYGLSDEDAMRVWDVVHQLAEQGDVHQGRVSAETHTPGTRVQVVHPSQKGQRGSIVKHRGTDSATGEDTYDIQLDNGEKAEGLRGSDFDRIKSAAKVDHTSVEHINATENHFFGSMTFQSDERSNMPMWWDEAAENKELLPDNPPCPMCGGPGEPLGTLGSLDHFRCRNCGAQFNTRGGIDNAGYGAGEAGDPAGWAERGLRDGKVADKAPPGAWPASDRPKNPSGLPEPDKFDGNKTKFPYDPPAQDAPYDEPDLSGGDSECPNCHSNASSMGELNAREYFRCSNGDCGMEFSLPNSDESAKWGLDDPDKMFGQDKPSYSSAQTPVDVGGSPLQKEHWYIVHGESYRVPDVVKITDVGDEGITAHFETDKEGQFPFKVRPDEYGHYSFDPYSRSDDPVEQDLKAQKSASGWLVEARRSFSPKEQRDLVEENLDGRARNYDKLNLEGTHYEARETSFSIIDNDFLWQ